MTAKVKTISTASGSKTDARTEEQMEDLHPSKARKLLLGFTCGDLLLHLLFREEIPHRDYIMCRVGLILLMFFATFESSSPKSPITLERFRKIFATLSTFEIVFAILIPWMIILEGILNKDLTRRNGHLLAAHLFIFQAQIAGECIIALAGDRRGYLIFPFTCVANAYRGVTLGTWIMRVMGEDVVEFRDVILPAITTCLWIYSSFIFIPREWYPLLKK
eukprot:975527_1